LTKASDPAIQKPGPIATPTSAAASPLGNVGSAAIASPARQLSTSSITGDSHFSDIFNKFSLPNESTLDQAYTPSRAAGLPGLINNPSAPVESPSLRTTLSNDNMALPFGGPAGLAAASFVPSSWYYQDPTGVVQGTAIELIIHKKE
jgi:hypothetical protein